MVRPEGRLEIGAEVREWEHLPSDVKVKEYTHNLDFDRVSGNLLDDDVQKAR